MEQEHLTELRQILIKRFNESELSDWCYDLGVDYESLPGKSKADKARELLTYYERRNQVAKLVETGRKQRPDILWPDIKDVPNPDDLDEQQTSEPGLSIKQPTGAASPPPEKRGCTTAIQVWWHSQDPKVQGAIITALASIIVAMCGLFRGIPQDIVQSILTTSPPTPSSTYPCLGRTDAEAIICLIQAEAEAVVIGSNGESNKGIAIIQDIFDENAFIQDAASGEEWHDPAVRYQTLFANARYISVENLEIQPAGSGVTEDLAWFTSESQGTFIADGKRVSYSREPRECHWTLRKNDSGCWLITEFVFNASDVSFPP